MGYSLSSDYRYIGASVMGSGHKASNIPCQDAHRVMSLDDALIIVVSDGAGSAAHSDIGSKIAVNSTAEYIFQHFEEYSDDPEDWQPLLVLAIQRAQDALNIEAEMLELELRELSCTLIVALLGKNGIAVAQIGDGAAVYLDHEGNYHTLCNPQHGEFINQTIFITSNKAEIDTTFHDEAVKGVAVFSDGIEMLALERPDNIPYVPFFAPLMKFAAKISDQNVGNEQLARFLSSERVQSRTSDDITLVLAIQTNSP